jgi:hypothetical protein
LVAWIDHTTAGGIRGVQRLHATSAENPTVLSMVQVFWIGVAVIDRRSDEVDARLLRKRRAGEASDEAASAQLSFFKVRPEVFICLDSLY